MIRNVTIVGKIHTPAEDVTVAAELNTGGELGSAVNPIRDLFIAKIEAAFHECGCHDFEIIDSNAGEELVMSTADAIRQPKIGVKP